MRKLAKIRFQYRFLRSRNNLICFCISFILYKWYTYRERGKYVKPFLSFDLLFTSLIQCPIRNFAIVFLSGNNFCFSKPSLTIHPLTYFCIRIADLCRTCSLYFLKAFCNNKQEWINLIRWGIDVFSLK